MMERNQELNMYIRNLLVETLPKSQRTPEVLDRLQVDQTGNYVALQLLLSRDMMNLIHSKDEDQAAIWKRDFHQVIEDYLTIDQVSVLTILNLQPIVRTVILHVGQDDNHSLIEQLKKAFIRLNNQVDKQYKSRLTACFGQVVDDFFKLGRSYKRSRDMQEYHYTSGLDKCSFFDIDKPSQKLSIIEYKYLHMYEELLDKEDWISLFDMSETIKKVVMTNRINDSKTMYIYKELFSMTIRHLFKQPDRYKYEIESLNRGIISFEHLFDQVDDIHKYYMNVFNKVSGIDLKEGMNPHIKKALHIIQQRYNRGLGLDEIAHDLGLSVEYLSRLFKEEVGYNFKKYLTYYRLDKAKELLETTNKEIKEIRHLVGYQSPSQFVRAFKANEGMTPSRYRRFKLGG